MPARYLILGVLILLAAACARRRDVTVQSGTAGLGDSLFVEIINDNYYDARVHLVFASGGPRPLGTVPGNQRSTVHTVPWQPQPVFFEVSLVVPGGGTYRSERIDVSPGDVVQVRVPPNLRTSGFFRRIEN